MDTINLKDHEAKVSNYEKEIAELKLSDNKAQGFIKTQTEEIKSLKETIEQNKEAQEKKEREIATEKLFSENAISKAQKDAIDSGETDVLKILSLNKGLNINSKGSDNDVYKTIKLSEEDLAHCKKFGYDIEEYKKHNNL